VECPGSGGLELLFDGQKEFRISIPSTGDKAELTIRDVLAHIKATASLTHREFSRLEANDKI
jgi:hypothetical protein